MDAKEIVGQIIERLGGVQNIVAVTNCMTRLRVVVKNEAAVNEAALKEMPDVLGLVHDRTCSYEIVVGPGKSRKFADICHDRGLPAVADGAVAVGGTGVVGGDWKQNKEKVKSGQKKNKVKAALKVFGDIFIPLIPGIIAAGLCAGFASLITQLVPDYASIPAWNAVYTLLSLINASFMTFITAWAGYRAAERFGATPILGGMLGLITSLDGVNTIAQILGLFNEVAPLQSILRAGRGGVLAVIVGVLVLAYVEKAIRKRMPESVDIVFTPLLSLIVVTIPYILVIMPLLGYVSSAIVWVFGQACLSESVIVRAVTGFLASAVFLPLVAAGMHHGLVALYSVQLQEIGYITLYPALAMAGAGQVGAALALLRKAKREGNTRLVSVIRGALPAGFLGVGEPLIYGVTIPLGKPFITAGLGAGFGGAFVMIMQVASTTWGPSGLLGPFVMTQGPNGAVASIVCYLIGLLISYVMGFIITNAFVRDEEVAPAPVAAAEEAAPVAPAAEVAARSRNMVKHGDEIRFGNVTTTEFFEFRHTIKDPLGIHARPAGELAQLIKSFNCHFTIETNGRIAENGSVLQLMSLGAAQGSELVCKAEGPDAAVAAKEVRKFMELKL